jgi:hypothetical protein
MLYHTWFVSCFLKKCLETLLPIRSVGERTLVLWREDRPGEERALSLG